MLKVFFLAALVMFCFEAACVDARSKCPEPLTPIQGGDNTRAGMCNVCKSRSRLPFDECLFCADDRGFFCMSKRKGSVEQRARCSNTWVSDCAVADTPASPSELGKLATVGVEMSELPQTEAVVRADSEARTKLQWEAEDRLRAQQEKAARIEADRKAAEHHAELVKRAVQERTQRADRKPAKQRLQEERQAVAAERGKARAKVVSQRKDDVTSAETAQDQLEHDTIRWFWDQFEALTQAQAQQQFARSKLVLTKNLAQLWKDAAQASTFAKSIDNVLTQVMPLLLKQRTPADLSTWCTIASRQTFCDQLFTLFKDRFGGTRESLNAAFFKTPEGVARTQGQLQQMAADLQQRTERVNVWATAAQPTLDSIAISTARALSGRLDSITSMLHTLGISGAPVSSLMALNQPLRKAQMQSRGEADVKYMFDFDDWFKKMEPALVQAVVAIAQRQRTVMLARMPPASSLHLQRDRFAVHLRAKMERIMRAIQSHWKSEMSQSDLRMRPLVLQVEPLAQAVLARPSSTDPEGLLTAMEAFRKAADAFASPRPLSQTCLALVCSCPPSAADPAAPSASASDDTRSLCTLFEPFCPCPRAARSPAPSPAPAPAPAPARKRRVPLPPPAPPLPPVMVGTPLGRFEASSPAPALTATVPATPARLPAAVAVSSSRSSAPLFDDDKPSPAPLRLPESAPAPYNPIK